MTIDRRNFFRTMGVAGLTLTGIDALASAPEKTDEVEFRGVLFDATRCVGCRTCEMECAKAHGYPEPTEEMVADVTRKTSETQRCVVNAFTTDKGEIYVRNQCMHCNEPACAAACLTQAMYKTKEGPVIWRADKCMGCRYCMVSCPFDVPKFEYHSANPKIVKCDMCYDRQKEGKLPVCVENCPAEAVFFGTRRELIAEARKRIAENPDAYIHEIYGESEAGGTSNLYVTPTQFNELGLNTKIQKDSYPALTKGFLYSVPAVFVLLPSLLLGIHEATKKNNPPKSDDND